MPISAEQFGEFSNEVVSRLSSIETKMDTMSDDIHVVKAVVDGNGDEGLRIKVDRLDQNDKRQSWLMKTTIGAAISALFIALADWFFHR